MKKITLKNAEKFKLWLIEEEKSDATIEKYTTEVNNFINYLDGRELVKERVMEYKKILTEKYAPASVNTVIASLNSFFEFIGEPKLKVKSLKIQKRIFSDKEKDLSREEYKRLLLAAQKKNNKRIFYLMQTICSTGIRVSELKFITAEAIKMGSAQINCKGKMRLVMIPQKLCRALEKYAKMQKIEKGPIFVTKSGKPIDRSNIWHDMKKLCIDANVSRKKVFPHNLRHLFARTYYSVQKDIVRLADILGHSSINTTRIYTIETGEIHSRQIQKLGLLLC